MKNHITDLKVQLFFFENFVLPDIYHQLNPLTTMRELFAKFQLMVNLYGEEFTVDDFTKEQIEMWVKLIRTESTINSRTDFAYVSTRTGDVMDDVFINTKAIDSMHLSGTQALDRLLFSLGIGDKMFVAKDATHLNWLFSILTRENPDNMTTESTWKLIGAYNSNQYTNFEFYSEGDGTLWAKVKKSVSLNKNYTFPLMYVDVNTFIDILDTHIADKSEMLNESLDLHSTLSLLRSLGFSQRFFSASKEDANRFLHNNKEAFAERGYTVGGSESEPSLNVFLHRKTQHSPSDNGFQANIIQTIKEGVRNRLMALARTTTLDDIVSIYTAIYGPVDWEVIYDNMCQYSKDSKDNPNRFLTLEAIEDGYVQYTKGSVSELWHISLNSKFNIKDFLSISASEQVAVGTLNVDTNFGGNVVEKDPTLKDVYRELIEVKNLLLQMQEAV